MRCAMYAPSVFDADEIGLAVVLTPEVPLDLEGEVEQAIANCPESAIAIAPDDGEFPTTTKK